MSEYAPDHRLVPEQPCPACGYLLDTVREVGAAETALPQPGDETMCWRCTTILVLGPLGELRVEDPREISAQMLIEQADLQAFQRRVPRGGEAP